MSPHDDDRLAAEYALGLLDGEERARAEARIANDPSFRDEVAGWQRHFSALDGTAVPVAPSAALWDGIQAGLGVAGLAGSLPTGAKPVAARPLLPALAALWRDLTFWRAAGLAGAAASIALAVALGVGERAAPPVFVAVLVTDANRPAAVVNAFADGHAELVPLEAIPVPAGRALQLWTLWDRARGPVSLGVLRDARTMRLGLDGVPRTGPNQLFEITLEPETGSPTGRPTGPILMKGLTSQAL